MKNEASNGYWNNTHPRAFENMTVRVSPHSHYVSCPVCHGHGAWHLAHYPNTRKDFYAYFDASCSQCFGWGYVDPNTVDASCTHVWEQLSYEESRNRGLQTGRCWTNHKCSHCNKIMGVDSSD
jgi:hypothetical protein